MGKARRQTILSLVVLALVTAVCFISFRPHRNRAAINAPGAGSAGAARSADGPGRGEDGRVSGGETESLVPAGPERPSRDEDSSSRSHEERPPAVIAAPALNGAGDEIAADRPPQATARTDSRPVVQGDDRRIPESEVLGKIADLLQGEKGEVEEELAGAEGFGRDDLLARAGRSSAASGRFDRAAAAYTIFLQEFGLAHAYSAGVAMRLADCLAPLDLDSAEIVHGASGPEFHPRWGMGHRPRPELLRMAPAAYELAATLAADESSAARARLKVGWVYRALNEWDASTKTWDTCAADSTNSQVAAEALWLAAENQHWTGRPLEASRLLQRLLEGGLGQREQTWASAARREIETLEAEARRDAAWLRDPVPALRSEIEQRCGSRAPHEVYREVMTWLSRRGEVAARLAVARWATAQHDWPLPAGLAAHADTADALLSALPPTGAAQAEAAAVFGELIRLAPDDDWLVPAALRRSVLLRDTGKAAEAAAMWAEVLTKTRGPRVSGADVLSERIRVLAAVGELAEARRLCEELAQKHPDHPDIDELWTLVGD